MAVIPKQENLISYSKGPILEDMFSISLDGMLNKFCESMNLKTILSSRVAKLSINIISIGLLIFGISLAFPVNAQHGGDATGGAASGGESNSGPTSCHGGTCNYYYYGGEATWAVSTGGSAANYDENSVSTSSKSVSSWIKKGNNLYDLGMYNESLVYYEKALAINPDNKDALVNMGNTLVKLHECTEAMTYVDRALAINPDNEYALTLKGKALYNLQKYNEAIIYVDRALAINPDNEEAAHHKGWAYAKLEIPELRALKNPEPCI